MNNELKILALEISDMFINSNVFKQCFCYPLNMHQTPEIIILEAPKLGQILYGTIIINNVTQFRQLLEEIRLNWNTYLNSIIKTKIDDYINSSNIDEMDTTPINNTIDKDINDVIINTEQLNLNRKVRFSQTKLEKNKLKKNRIFKGILKRR